MDCAAGSSKRQKLFSEIIDFVAKSSGLRATQVTVDRLRVDQALDGKGILISADLLDEVLLRSDAETQEFIQINYSSGQKILLTDKLIGFKPIAQQGLDSSRLPRVVTTPDVVNVFEAIQDAIHGAGAESHELAILKKIFESVLIGGEAVGFDLRQERSWMARIPSSLTRVSS